jgi:hypothetical protein
MFKSAGIGGRYFGVNHQNIRQEILNNRAFIEHLNGNHLSSRSEKDLPPFILAHQLFFFQLGYGETRAGP